MAFNDVAEELLAGAAEAVRKARREALAEGHPITYKDSAGRYVQEHPDGRIFEIRFDPSLPRESHVIAVRELTLAVV